jgi:uncharacterized protein YdhG (YjbR/CyaY superfamily)
VSTREIGDYLTALDEPKRGTLDALRRSILTVIPDAEQCISYGLPAFRVDGTVVASFGALTNHLSYFPHSGSVVPEVADDLASDTTSTGALRCGRYATPGRSRDEAHCHSDAPRAPTTTKGPARRPSR